MLPARARLLCCCAALLAAGAAATPILGVPTLDQDEPQRDSTRHGVLVVTTTEAPAEAHVVGSSGPERMTKLPEDVVPLDSPKERSRFLVTLLMLESLRDKPGSAAELGVHAKLKAELLADEEIMQEVLKLYESQQETHEGKPYIKIPQKLLKKIKRIMKDLLSE